MRLLVVGHAYVVAANRGKLRWMARDPDVTLALACPDRWPEPEFGERVVSRLDEPFAVFALPMTRAGHVRRARYDRRALARAMDAFRPEVVQIEQEPASLAAWQCARLARRSGARTVLFAWDNLPGGRFPLTWMGRRVCAGASRILAGNRAALALLEAGGFGGKSGVLPQLGVDPEAFAGGDGEEARRRLGLSGFVIGFAGRLLERKGVFDLLDAFARLRGEATLALIGDGPAAGPLRERAAALGAAERVRFISGVPHEAMPRHLAALSVLVLPSRSTAGWAEQFGHVLVEAMAAGVPVIGSDSGAIPEVVGDAGLIFPEGDAEALARALARVREEDGLRDDVVGRGRARVAALYSDEAIARRTIQVARDAMGGIGMSAARAVPPIDPAAVRRVLVVKPDQIGDLMIAAPSLLRLRRAFPEARIDVLGRPNIHAFTLAQGLADVVIPFAPPWLDRVAPGLSDWPRLASLVVTLRRERYDLAVNLRHDFRELLLTALSGARRTLSYDHRGLARLVTHSPGAPDPDAHDADRWARLLSFAGVAETGPFRPRVSGEAREAALRVLAPLAADRPRIAVHVRPGRPAKEWPMESWEALVRAIVQDVGGSVVLLGGAEERAARAAFAGDQVVDAAGGPLAALPALLSECRALIGPDSGPAHMAALVGLPTVALFSGTDLPTRFRPVGGRVAVLEHEVPCRPCHKRVCDVPGHPCMRGIAVEEVVSALREALR